MDRKTIISGAFIGLLVAACQAPRTDVITAYYTPLDVETLMAVTPKEAACQSHEEWKVSDKADIQRLIHILEDKKGSAVFDTQRVRAKILSGTAVYYVDAEGGVLKGTQNYQIDRNALMHFADTLNLNELETHIGFGKVTRNMSSDELLKYVKDLRRSDKPLPGPEAAAPPCDK